MAMGRREEQIQSYGMRSPEKKQAEKRHWQGRQAEQQAAWRNRHRV